MSRPTHVRQTVPKQFPNSPPTVITQSLAVPKQSPNSSQTVRQQSSHSHQRSPNSHHTVAGSPHTITRQSLAVAKQPSHSRWQSPHSHQTVAGSRQTVIRQSLTVINSHRTVARQPSMSRQKGAGQPGGHREATVRSPGGLCSGRPQGSRLHPALRRPEALEADRWEDPWHHGGGGDQGGEPLVS